MTTGRRKSERSTRRKLSSPGRPPVWQREHLCRFWREVAAGLSSEEAAVAVGVSPPVGTRWFRSSGGMPPTHLAPSAPLPKCRNLSFAEREEIALECVRGTECGRSRASWADLPARFLGRSGATRRRAAGSSTIGPLRRSGMPIVRPDGRRPASSRSIQLCATTFRIGCRASLPHRTASLSMAPSWYGKGGGLFVDKADAGHLPGAQNKSSSA